MSTDKKINYTMVLPSGEEEGHYSTTVKGKPRDAAKKAAAKHMNRDGQLRITIRRLNTDKTFTYQAVRKTLDEPIVRRLPNGSTYEIKVKITVTRVKGANK